MKHKAKFALSLLFITPLLMSNSPAPYPSTDRYEELDVTYTLLDRVDIGDGALGYRYQLDALNTGELYANTRSWNIKIKEGYLSMNPEGLLFDDEAIIPKESKTYYVTLSIELEPEDDTWITNAFSVVDEDVTFANYSIERVQDKKYKLKADISGLGDYYYCALVEVTYNEERYAFSVYLNNTDSLISTFEELELDKLSIDKITAFRSSYQKYKMFGCSHR